MSYVFSGKPWYNSRRDGNLEEYLKGRSGGLDGFPLFNGYRHYRMLWEHGYLEPGLSVIRLMWNVAREDEHFLVVDEDKIEGIEAPAHAGRPGIHDSKKILSGDSPAWEVHGLNRHPKARKQKQKKSP